MNKSEVLFTETQHFRQIWVWIFIGATSLFFLFGLYQQIILGQPVSDDPTTEVWMIVISLFIGLGIPLIFYNMKLITQVRSDGVYLRFIPFHFTFRKYGFNEFKSWQPKTYNSIREYGGWGIRKSPLGIAYNVSGHKGVVFELANDQELMVGTRKPDDFVKALNSAQRSSS